MQQKGLAMTSPKQALQARYIYDEAIAAGWAEGANYWRYPVFAPDGTIIAYRLKRYPFADTKANKAKYLWDGEKPEATDSQWYILPETQSAIEAAHGVVYVANGEPALVTYHAGGIHNVISTTLSEIAFPKDGVNYLKKRGINRLLYVADKDAAGLKSACNWRDALAGSGIDFEALQWPANMPEKADANDVLIAVAGDKAKFQAILKNLEPLELPAAEPKKKTPKLDSEPLLTPQGLIDTIASALGASEFAADGFTRKNVLCPFHDDSVGNESAGFNRISGVLNCFACGSHSPRETAEKLGIDWKRFYSQKESKPKKAKPVRQNVPVTDTVTEVTQDDFITMGDSGFTEIIPMAAYGTNVFANFEKRGWIDQDELPLSWVRAFLHLTHSKSATTVYAVRLHQAFRSGKLNQDGFTITDAMNYLESPRPSTQAALDFLTFCNCLMILDTKYLDTTIGVSQSLKNTKGRKAIVYAVNNNTEFIIDTIISLLEPALLERLTEDDLAPLNATMRDSLELDFTEWKAWREKTHTSKQQYTLDLINKILCEVLESRASYQFSLYDLQSPAHLRAKLLNAELAPYSEEKYITDKETGEITVIPRTGIQLSRAKLALQLGCSLAAMSNLYELANVGSERKRGWHEVINPNGCDILRELREAPLNLNKELSGVALGASMKVNDNGKERFLGLAYGDRAVNLYNAWNGHILKLYIFVEQPSLLWNMSADEIAQKAAKEAQENQAALDSAETTEERAIVQEKIEKKAEKKARKPSFISTGDRLYKGHKPDWMAEKLGAYVHVWTWHKLEGLTIVDEDSAIVAACQNLAEVVKWLNRNAETKQVRTIESYYKPIESVEESEEMPPMPEVKTPEPIIQAPKVVLMPVVEKPKHKPAPNYEGWCWANNPDEFIERMRSIGAKV